MKKWRTHNLGFNLVVDLDHGRMRRPNLKKKLKKLNYKYKIDEIW